MKIGFDVSQTGKDKAGCGYFAENLIDNLINSSTEHQYVLYPHFGDHYWDSTQKYSHKKAKKIDLKHNPASAKTFWQQLPEGFEKILGEVDIIHANNFHCISKLKKTKLVYTLYDLSFMVVPECTTEQNRLACLEGVLKASIYADHIIAISNYTKQQFLAFFPHFSSENITVAYPSSRFENQTKATKSLISRLNRFEVQRFWLFVGTLEPRKNIKRILEAYARVNHENRNHKFPLVLAGKEGWIDFNLKKEIYNLGLQGQVHILGYVTNAELIWLYKNCFCLLNPSLLEGFGLPIIEAMKLAAPIITSNVSSLPEISGDAALLVDPKDIGSIQNAMTIMLKDENLRLDLCNKSINQAKKFSWMNTAKTVLEVYGKLMIPS